MDVRNYTTHGVRITEPEKLKYVVVSSQIPQTWHIGKSLSVKTGNEDKNHLWDYIFIYRFLSVDDAVCNGCPRKRDQII